MTKPKEITDPTKVKAVKARIKAELDAMNFGGYCGTSDFFQYDWPSFQSWCQGQLLICIGQGRLSNAVYNLLQWGMAWKERENKRQELCTKYGINFFA